LTGSTGVVAIASSDWFDLIGCRLVRFWLFLRDQARTLFLRDQARQLFLRDQARQLFLRVLQIKIIPVLFPYRTFSLTCRAHKL
jgi:hypothetical protein